MAKKLGIPYMGSKRKLASEILSKIIQRHEGITDFYDLFGGGGSISFLAIRDYRFNVHYNELNKHIYSLVEYLKTHKTLEPKFYEWVAREEFFKQCNRLDADWYSGFVMSCWSFGNNSEKGYLYGADIENIKRLAHEFIVNGCYRSMFELGLDIPELINIKDVQKRRIKFCNYIKTEDKSRFDVQSLERIVQLERLQNLQNLQINNGSYKDIKISGNNSIIYCDIPYKGTVEYKEGNFNHEEFYQWANEIEHPVYISEYDAPFEKIETFKHRSSLSATNNKKVTFESIYWNGKGNINNYKLF